ncbi:MAG: NAD(P)/FAD-dependent oxidoreductase [Bdellovibrionales bacterium]|nr:NAD(P)/FAD-dependent oxidoreductase [Bdellovibrionales bacterium]
MQVTSLPHYDTLIIGAGMSGLAAGIRLAHFDQKVAILERHSLWGGLNSFYRQAGRSFDVGLHAMTNFAVRGTRKGPLPTIFRQLRIDWDEFALIPQRESRIQFPNAQLRFSNDLSLLESEVERNFPQQIDGFRKLCRSVRDHDDGHLNQEVLSARQRIQEHITDRLLEDMLLCPLMFYGSAREDDMDWNQFVIMFKSLFFEGFARPHEGVRKILTTLKKHYLDRGGELKMKTGVSRLIPQKGGGVMVKLDSGESLFAKKVLSSAGFVETKKLLGTDLDLSRQIGALSFVESIFCLDRMPSDLDISSTILFYSQQTDFHYRQSKNLVDYRSGIVCCPNNFADPEPLSEGMIRLTHIANHSKWVELKQKSEELYLQAKAEMIKTELDELENVLPSFRKHIVYTDTFTPSTIEHYTGHLGGAVYGSPRKRPTGEIGEKDIFLCGTDQGYLGIVGSMLSGIIMANQHALK